MTAASLNFFKSKMIQVCAQSREGHLPSAFSIFDILWVLYSKILKIDPLDPKNSNRDYFVLSKGHGSLGLYATLAAHQFFKMEELDSFGEYSSRLGGHPDCNKVPGVEASTGSLGHGMPFAVGLALAQKIEKKSSRTYALIGDGESNEGTIWESALLAAHQNLKNLTVIVDFNHSTDRALSLGNLVSKWKSFEWETLSISGHNHDEIEKALRHRSDRPVAIIAETIKGYGCKSLENNPAWHHRSPTLAEVDQLIGELHE